jgi:hypothetical protein
MQRGLGRDVGEEGGVEEDSMKEKINHRITLCLEHNRDRLIR